LKKGPRNFQLTKKQIMWDENPCIALIFNELTDREAFSALYIADKEKERVISTINHELTTPINGISSLLEACIDLSTNKEQREYLRNCQSCTKLLLYLVQSIVDLSKCRQGIFALNCKEFNLSEFLNETKALFTYQAK
jgi:signal transduction histidine kinase